MRQTEHEVFQSISTIKQVVATFSVFSMSLSLGASSGFSGVAMPQLQDPVYNHFALNQEQVSWFASLSMFAMIPTCILGGMMGDLVGRRFALLMVAPIGSIGFACQAMAQDFAMLLFGRILTGCAAGLASGPTAVYVTEVSVPRLRTTFGAGISGSYNVGMVLIFALGSFCHWRVLAGISALFPALGFFAMLFIPESPAWLLSHGYTLEADRATRWFMTREKKEQASNPEVDDLLSSLALEAGSRRASFDGIFYDTAQSEPIPQGARVGFISNLPDFRQPEIWKPVLIVIALFGFQQASGMSALSFYAVNIFAETGSGVNEYVSTIIFGLTRLISQILGSMLLIRFKRRTLVMVSGIGVSVGFCLLATSSYWNNKWNESMGILPLTGVVILALTYHIGLGPIPWSYTAELFPLEARSFMSGLCNCIGNLFIFIAVKIFPNLIAALKIDAIPNGGGPAGAFWLFSGMALLAVIFALIVLPETKDKTFDEISHLFKKPRASTSKQRAHVSA